MNKVIQVLKPNFRTDEVLEEIRECLDKGWTGIGFKTTEFEVEWKKFTGFSHAHFLNSATSGLHLAVKILKDKYQWNEGDEIITTSLTFVSTNHAILYEGLNPCFCDIDDSLCLDPDEVRKAITSKTRAIMYVGIGGNASNYKAIKAIADSFGLPLILDAAHMAGTRWIENGNHVGLDADCAIFSFQAVKNCPSSDSGMICFKDQELDHRARMLSWLGIDKSTYDRFSESSYKWRYDVNELGFKYNGNAIAASICLVSLKYLEVDNARRRQIVDQYKEILNEISGVKVVNHDPEIISSRHLFQIRVKNRDVLMDKLAEKQIFCGVHYIANHKYKIYKNFYRELPLTNEITDQVISLPLHLGLEDIDILRIGSEIKNFYKLH